MGTAVSQGLSAGVLSAVTETTAASGETRARSADSPDGALELDPGQQHGEGDVVLVQHASGHAVERHLETRHAACHQNTAVPGRAPPPPIPGAPPHQGSQPALYLEEVLGDDGQALRVVGDALQVGVLVQDVVVDVQEELQRVLVQKVDLQGAEGGREGL